MALLDVLKETIAERLDIQNNKQAQKPNTKQNHA
jgi:hypothetical protein